MGRGDKKSAKGKRTIGSFGVSRPRKKSTYPATTSKADEVVEENAKPVAKKTTAKKTTAKKTVAKKATKESEEAK